MDASTHTRSPNGGSRLSLNPPIGLLTWRSCEAGLGVTPRVQSVDYGVIFCLVQW